MKLYANNLLIRIGATLLSTGYAVVGIFAIRASSNAPNADLADRAFWMGVTFLVAAVASVAVSWLVRDLSNIWCIPARRTPLKRQRLDDGE